MCLKV
jgi:hypothetical protein